MTEMWAAVCRDHGDPSTVRIDAWPAPAVAAGQVRVRIHAAAVNFPDVLIVANDYQIKVPTPFIPGSEFAGVVDVVGDGVSDIAVGDRVTGTGITGAFAEFAVVDAAAATKIPSGIDDRSAAAFGVAHRTAYHVLRSVARVLPGEELVVLGAGGGVGLAAVQLGVALGASVTAVASTNEKLAVAESYGARRLVNHRAEEVRAALRDRLPSGSDVVVDPVGGELSEPALRSLRWGGRFVSVGYASGVIPRIPLNLVLLKGIAVLGFEFLGFATHAAAVLQRDDAELLGLLADGRIRPHVGAVFARDDIVAALRHVADGRAIGKVVIDLTG